MSVRAKFRCFSTTIHDPAQGYNGTVVALHAVYGDGSDNASWSKATPHGRIEMTITVPEAAGAFVPGTEYWLDFTPIAAAPEQDAASAVAQPARQNTVSTDAGNLLRTGQDGLPYLSAAAIDSAERSYPDEIQVGDVIDPVPEAGHDGPQYVTGVTQHPDGTALELRPATPEEIAASAAPDESALVQPAETKGWQDPVNEANASSMRIDSGLSTPAPAPSPEPTPAQAA